VNVSGAPAVVVVVDGGKDPEIRFLTVVECLRPVQDAAEPVTKLCDRIRLLANQARALPDCVTSLSHGPDEVRAVLHEVEALSDVEEGRGCVEAGRPPHVEVPILDCEVYRPTLSARCEGDSDVR